MSAHLDLDDVAAGHPVAMQELERLRSELAEARRDAERYRWLRVQEWWDSPLAVVANPKAAIKLGHHAPSRDRLDALVDAGIAVAQGFDAAMQGET